MALQSDAIQSRLEGLKLDDRRMYCDSKLRAFRIDSQPPPMAENRASKPARKAEPDFPVDQVISLLEELSRRIDGLEKKNRQIGDEIRHQVRIGRRWRSILVAGGLAASGFIVVRWVMHWI
jgi:hypothetical protein